MTHLSAIIIALIGLEYLSQLRNFIVSKVGCYANLEQIINHELVPDKNKRADMVVRFENGTQDLVDVTVVHPGAISYCSP